MGKFVNVLKLSSALVIANIFGITSVNINEEVDVLVLW